MSARQPLRPNAQGRLRRRMQDMYPPHDSISMEGRPNGTHKGDEHLFDMRAPEELLSVLHARLVVWSPYRGA